MRTPRFLTIALAAAVLMQATFSGLRAFPPAPGFTIFGQVRDPYGWLVASPDATIVFKDLAGKLLTTSKVGGASALTENYRVRLPIDHARTGTPYRPSATAELTPFVIHVVINGVQFVPTQTAVSPMPGAKAAEFLHLDLTLGVDADLDGLPDEWEQWQLEAAGLDPFALHLINPGDDLDGDGMTNLQEYIAGTFAYLGQDRLVLELKEVYGDGWARAEFLAVVAKAYTLESSPDMVTWTGVDFGLWNDRSALQTAWTAHDTLYQTIQVPVGTAPGAERYFYRLTVR